MEACRWCSTDGSQVYHSGHCPQVAEITYYRNGAVKRVRFHDASPVMPVTTTYPTYIRPASPWDTTWEVRYDGPPQYTGLAWP